MYYIGVDIGGTFTDCVLVDREGNHRTAKTLSTKDDPVSGVLAGLERLAETVGVGLTTLLERTERFGHGTTIGTNAVLERSGARVGLVATAGHGDALAMMRGAGRVAGQSIEGVFSVHGSRLPAPLIVPGAVVEVQERIDASGKVVVELDTDAAVERITRLIAEYELDSIAVAPLGTIDSGPAGGLIGVATLAGAYGHDHVVATDMGGTSFDLGLVIDGKPVVAEEDVIDQYTYRLPNLDVRSIACGGGSIAWFDEATGGLRVGPASAGSEPGPACYGRGGAEPTVTDADVVLGLVRADTFLDGRMPLDRDAAVAAVGRLAGRLGLTVAETGAGIGAFNNSPATPVGRARTPPPGPPSP